MTCRDSRGAAITDFELELLTITEADLSLVLGYAQTREEKLCSEIIPLTDKVVFQKAKSAGGYRIL